MVDITKSEKNILFRQVRVMLGANSRGIELDDETLDVLLGVSIDEYSAAINDWLTQQQWSTLQNSPTAKNDLIYALTTKTLDFEKSFTYSYSKQAGLGTNSEWELKKDYIIVSGDTQEYIIPAKREITECLWITPPQLGSGLGIDNLSPAGVTAAGFGFNFYGTPMMSVLPSFSMFLSTQDIKMKKQILQSDLTYKIAGGPNGTKKLFLYPIPGSKDEISGINGKHYDGSVVWYWYYDVDSNNRDACLDENQDIVRLPTDVQLDKLSYSKLNDSAKARIRRLLIAEAKNVLALNRGKFSGKLEGRNGKEVTMDYSFLLQQYNTEKEKIFADLDKFLEKLSIVRVMEERAIIANSLNDVLKHTPSVQSIFMI
jgi:hypothetical protein